MSADRKVIAGVTLWFVLLAAWVTAAVIAPLEGAWPVDIFVALPLGVMVFHTCTRWRFIR